MRSLRLLFAGLCAALLLPAQNVSSTVKGTVHDQSGAAIPHAQCVLTNSATGLKSAVESGSDGGFVFLDVLAGTYKLTVQAAGFKAFDLNDIVVTSSEFHPLNDIVLTVGQTTESVTVSEKTTPVQTSSGERSDTVTGTQLNDIAVKGRDFLSYMDTLPGVIDTSSTTRDAPGRNTMSGLHINGSRDTATIMMIDGTPSEDAGNNSNPEQSTMDSISEVKVLTDAYQAEYGRNGGGTVSVITKSGGEQFHGSAYEYYRNEELDANGFFNNVTGTPRQPYRYRITGYSIGGPLLIPKVPQIRHKLYVFFAQELLGSKILFAQKLVNTPTALERTGDYSQSKAVNGSLITITDPTTGKPFPGNIIPPSQINTLGQAMLKFYPLPNFVDTRPGFLYEDNYKSNFSGSWPRNQEVGRVDYNLSSKTQLYVRILNDTSSEITPWGNWVNGSVNYNLTPTDWERPAHMYTGHLTQTISPTTVDELIVAKDFNLVNITPVDPTQIQASKMGNPPSVFPIPALEANWIPNVSFGGTPVNTINGSIANQLPEALPDDGYVFSNNLSKVWGKHQFKAGIYVERNRKIQAATEPFRGAFDFSVNANNPNNTGDGFANGLLGDFNTYQQANNWPIGNYVLWNVEWFVQDNWRVSSRLTLDYGLRFYHDPPTYDRNHTVTGFVPGLYSAAQSPVLYQPALNGGKRVAQDPITGAFAPVSYIGLFVPGAGNTADGAIVGGLNGAPPGVITQPSLFYGPRFGFAYDVFGNGRTAIRGGFGMFTDRVQGNEIYNAAGNPPVTYAPTQYYGSLTNFTQSTGLLGPGAITEWNGHQANSEIMNFNLGIQHQIGSFVADIAYTGMLSRHLLMTYNMNPIPLYAHFNPANRDVTTASSPLPDNFLRPYIGYANITNEMFGASANYNSLQASINRRLTAGMQLSASYTFSKVLGVASADGTGVSSYFPARQYNYGPLTYDRRQSFVISYVYMLPNIGKRTQFKPAGWVLDNWEVSGITTFQTGAPFTPSFSTQPSVDISGSTDSARINVVGDPHSGPTSFYHEFNTAAFALPAVGTLGNAGTDILYGPGINNWDISVTKRFNIFSESRVLSFRGEFYNAFNHTQFSGWNSSFIFTPAGQQISQTVGQANAAFPAREIQISARFVF